MAIITLTTDFGHRDHYVACMKGVILRIAPTVRLIDVTHEIERHNVMQAAFALQQTVEWFPDGTVHLAVVDPGVGTDRRVIVARYGKQIVVAPDNGLISLIHHRRTVDEVRVLENPSFALPGVSATFHGRDIMGPAAARLASGAKMRDVGPLTDHIEVLPIARPQMQPDRTVRGKIISIDTFGNLITNIGRDELATVYRFHSSARVYLDEQCVGPMRRAYGEVALGQPLAIVGGTGLVEIAVNCGSAREHFAPSPDAVVAVR